ncbi:hypothetical protein NJB1907f44_14130 [Mycobacterium marinum]|nr:hypothetical protein NJB1907f34b_00890 [Mycobacterium marinum]GJO09746.1 hypothetical protein NJB1907E90_27190 [Mycobacterium marinum]GJO11948.1 hypothetical protein NJB1907E11_04560 [Mycobacterium marinum]GJO13151.1 hypothetical protein NJB1728e18_01270 [Mycobacterium marinum]GJO33602.1 hypothetical protein NJB1907E19_09380 [Mycobacterium marinum]
MRAVGNQTAARIRGHAAAERVGPAGSAPRICCVVRDACSNAPAPATGRCGYGQRFYATA